MAHKFGGKWTQQKLDKVGHYLQTYSTALKNQKFELIYVDAFAGTGYVNLEDKDDNQPFLPEFEETEVKEFVSGSAKNALEVTPPFDKYVW